VVCELVTDDQGVIWSAAAEAAALLAIEERFLIGKPLATFVATRDRRRFRKLLLGISRNGEVKMSLALMPREGGHVAAEIVASHDDGRIRWTVTTADGASPAAAAAISPDRWADRLLTRLTQGILVVDRNLRVVYANPAARRLLPDPGLRVGETMPDPWPEHSLRETAESLFGSLPVVGRRVLDVGSRRFAVEGLTSSDRQTGALLIADVTQDELKRRAEREFAENAAHELRTPVAAIRSVVDALESGGKNDPAVRDQFLAHIRRQADRLSLLATSLLLLRRMQEGMDQPHLDLIAAKPLLEDVAADLDAHEGVRVHVEAATELAMLADRDLLRQAVENVAANAARHTHEGEILLVARDVGSATELEIRDTGSGMSEEEVNQAFVRFHRSRASGGIGLGLPIAKEAVEALGGTIELESTLDVGTRVRMRLPSARRLS
jgi:two-component system, OmpR family, phosphate regulon sensor histidine kinase PhoR